MQQLYPVGMQNGAAAMEVVPQKIKKRTTMLSKNPTSGYLLKNLKSGSQRHINTPVFTVALFTTD